MTNARLLALPALLLAACAAAPDAANAQMTQGAADDGADAYAAIARMSTDEEVVGAMGGAMADGMLPVFEPMFAQAGVTDPAQKQAFADLFASEMVAMMQPELYAMTLAVIQENIGPGDAAQIAAFFETPAGQAYVDAMPAMTRAGAQAGQELGVRLAPDVVAAMAAKLQAGETSMDPEAAKKIAAMLGQTAP